MQPIYQTFIMFAWIVSGMMMFKETDNYSAKQLVVILLAVLVCFAGIYMLYTKKKAKKGDEEQDPEQK